MFVVVKLGGCNGSGKTTIGREVLRLIGADAAAPLGKARSTFHYSGIYEGVEVCVLGGYQNVCGGMDGISDKEDRLALLRSKCRPRSPRIVFYEGLITGKTYGAMGALSEAHVKAKKGSWLYAFMNTPWKECVRRVLKRRKAAGNDASFDPERTMRPTFESCDKLARKLRQEIEGRDGPLYPHPVHTVAYSVDPAIEARRLLDAALSMFEVSNDHFWRHVDKSGPCWLWNYTKNRRGYGIYTQKGGGKERVTAHRYSYELAKGKTELMVLHRCHIRNCVNPEHLYAGTAKQNAEDRDERRKPELVLKKSAVNDVAKFIIAREARRLHKLGGPKPKPDPILDTYRFCCPIRMDDRVSRWVMKYVIERWRKDPDLWFALLVARLFNNEETLTAISHDYMPFKPEQLRQRLHARRDAGLKNFNAAYIVSTNGRAMDKVDYLIDIVLKPLWAARKNVRLITSQNRLEDVHGVLMQFDGLGSFMAAQVVADLKYARPAQWEDFYTFVASGPGSRRGLNRVYGRPVNTPWREQDWRVALEALRQALLPLLSSHPNLANMAAQDVQNIACCEYDKRERARRGEGTPKQLYKEKPA